MALSRSSSLACRVGLGLWAPCLLLLVLLSVVGNVQALTKDEWRRRSIYQLVTDRFATTNGSTPRCVPTDYVKCGGSWGGIVSKLDYIQGMGFDAIWISPINQNLDSNAAYHGYWPADLFALQDTAANLQALTNALHSRGMALMIDLVVNDVAWSLPNATAVWDPTVGRSNASATDGTYGVLNRPEDYHPRCVIDYNNDTSVRNCWIGDPGGTILADLNTESPRVTQLLFDNLKSLISTYKIDGMRIDAAKHVSFSLWTGLQAAANGVFTMAEVLDGNPANLQVYQQPLDSVLNFALWYPLRRAFTSTSQSMSELSNMVGSLSNFPDPTILGNFVSNHDFARARALTSDSSFLANMFAFPYVADGIPIAYYGDEQGAVGADDPNNREALWTLGASAYDTNAAGYLYAAKLNAIRRAAGLFSLSFYTSKNFVVSNTANDLVLSKYPLLSIFTNRGAAQSGGSMLTVPTSYPAGTVVVNALTCAKSTVNSAGQLGVLIQGGLPQIFLPLQAIQSGSGFCANLAVAQTCDQKRAMRPSAASSAYPTAK